MLNKKGFKVYKNRAKTTPGDHFRNALQLYINNNDKKCVFFGFIDRILFDLETKYKDEFIKDVSRKSKNDLVIFSRSKYAWGTHPKDYFRIENIVSEAGKIFIKKDIDWIWCGALMNRKLIKAILQKSTSDNFSILTEFALIAFRNRFNVQNKKVDWQAWEDSFWGRENKSKVSFNMSTEEKEFRINYCADALKLFLKKFK